jgi:hypothetical protein
MGLFPDLRMGMAIYPPLDPERKWNDGERRMISRHAWQ